METTPDDRAHGYDDAHEEQAYQSAQESGDPDAGPAGEPEPAQPDQAEGEQGDA